MTKRHAKTPLFSGFFAILVPRETDTENQTVTRETYNFYTHHSPVNFAFSLEFYLLIFTVYILKTYVKSAFSFRFNTQIIVYKHRKLHTQPLYTSLAIFILLLESSKHRSPEASHAPLKEQYANHIKRCLLFVAPLFYRYPHLEFSKNYKLLFHYCLAVL